MSLTSLMYGRTTLDKEIYKVANSIVEKTKSFYPSGLAASFCKHQRVQTACQNFMVGVRTVEQNFLANIIWKGGILGLIVETICKESLVASKYGTKRLRWLSRMIHATDQCTSAIYGGLLNTLLLPLSPWFANEINFVLNFLGSNKWLSSVVRAPLLEELVCRQLLSILLQLGLPRKPFNFISSVFFGLTHVSNHTDNLPKSFSAISDKEAICTEAIIPAINQSIACCSSSILWYTPLFESHGVLASIGAHMTWNAIATNNKVLGGVLIFQITRYWYRLFTDETDPKPDHPKTVTAQAASELL